MVKLFDVPKQICELLINLEFNIFKTIYNPVKIPVISYKSGSDELAIFIRLFEKRDINVIALYGQAHRRMQDGFHSISEEIFVVSSPTLVHRSTRARR